MLCSNNYLADILRVCEIKDLIWVMRFQSPLVYLMVHIGYFIDDICLPPADLAAFHFMASLSLILHLLYHQMQGWGGFKKDSTSGFLFS